MRDYSTGHRCANIKRSKRRLLPRHQAVGRNLRRATVVSAASACRVTAEKKLVAMAGSTTEDESPARGQAETRSDDSRSLSLFPEQIGRSMDGQESITSSQVLSDGTPKTPWNAKSKGLKDILLKPPDLRTEVEIEEVFGAIERLQDPFLSNLDQPVKRAMCQRLTWEEFQENEQIFDFGSVGDKLYIVWSGRVQLEVPDEKTSTETELHFVVDAAKLCSCEASLRQALQRLQAPTSMKESQSGIFGGLGESLEELGHKAKEALHRWHFLDGWSFIGDRAQDYMPEDVTEVLRSLREGSGVFGMDIGGTLAKAAQLLAPGESHISPSTFGKTGTFHKELSFQLKVKDVMHDVHFLSGATYYLEAWSKKWIRVSVLKLDASEDGKEPYFTRLGGTATGGAAFLGLVRMMTRAKTYPDCLALAQKGDATKVNKLVSDIYGQDGCSNLGLAPGLTAAHFAKITMKDFNHPDYSEEDQLPAPTRSRSNTLDDLTASGSAPLVSKAQLMGAAPYPGERKTPVFFVGGFLAENRRAWEIISLSALRKTTSVTQVKGAKMDSGKVFGEIALMSEDCKRKGRCTALKPTQLLIFYRDDYKWCVGASQETTVKERVAFLRMAEEGLLADMRYVDLQAMAGSLTEDFYIGEHEIIRQGTEVERIIFVKSGFCKILRELHPKYTKVFCRYANYAEPMPNPYAEGEGGLRVGEKGVWPRPQQPKPTAAARVAANAAAPHEGETEKKSTLKLESHQMLKKMLRLVQGEHEEGHVRERRTRTDTNSSSSAEETSQEKSRSLKVVVDIISKGSSVGVMELMEGLTYQCTVVCSPLAEIYSISRYDFIRNGPRPITHRLFCNYKARLSDKQLIWRLVQKHRWDHYKRGLLEEIRSWNSSASRGIVDREDPVPMIGGSALEDQTCIRIGRGEKLWDQRAQTPPNQAYDPDQAVKQIFHVQCSRDEQGKPLVQVEREQRDASMDEFERKLLETMANARYRDKLRRAKQKHAASHSALEDGKGANAVAIAQALEEEAKRSLEEQKQKEKERIEVMRQEVQAKVRLDRDASREKRNRRTITARASMRAPPSQSVQSARSRQSTKQVELPPLPGSSRKSTSPKNLRQSSRQSTFARGPMFCEILRVVKLELYPVAQGDLWWMWKFTNANHHIGPDWNGVEEFRCAQQPVQPGYPQTGLIAKQVVCEVLMR
eukprot:s24_g46.t3